MSSISPTSNKKIVSSRRRHSGDTTGSVSRSIAAPFQDDSVLMPLVLGKFDRIRSTDKGFPAHKKSKPLEELSKITFDRYCGPTPESNWVIPGSLLVGAYPASQSDEETFNLIAAILKNGISTFVCLQQEYRATGVTEAMWRSGAALRPYFQDVQYLVRVKDKIPEFVDHKIVDCKNLKFIHFPIKDCDITDDARVLDLAKSLVKSISDGNVLYLHCWGGHGRTGTVVCIMLHLMYGLNATASMAYCQCVHDLRRCPVVVGSPQTQSQRDQVKRVIEYLESHNASQQVQDPIRTPVNLSPPRTSPDGRLQQAQTTVDNSITGNPGMIFSLSPRSTPSPKKLDQQQQPDSISHGDTALATRDIHSELAEATPMAAAAINTDPSHNIYASLSSSKQNERAGLGLHMAIASVSHSSGAEMDIGSASKIGIVQKSDEFRSSLLVDIPAVNQISSDAMDISPLPSPVTQICPISSPHFAAFNDVEMLVVGETHENDEVCSDPLVSRSVVPISPSQTDVLTLANNDAHDSPATMPLKSDLAVVVAPPAFVPASVSAISSASLLAPLALQRVGSNQGTLNTKTAPSSSKASSVMVPPLQQQLLQPSESKPPRSKSEKGLAHPHMHGHADGDEEKSISRHSFSRSLPRFEEDPPTAYSSLTKVAVGALSSSAKVSAQVPRSAEQKKRPTVKVQHQEASGKTPDTNALSDSSPVSSSLSRRVKQDTATTPTPQSPVTPRSSAMSFLGSLRMMTGLGGGGSNNPAKE